MVFPPDGLGPLPWLSTGSLRSSGVRGYGTDDARGNAGARPDALGRFVLAVAFTLWSLSLARRFRDRNGVAPWHLHSLLWALIGFVLGLTGLLRALVARATTRRVPPARPDPGSPGGGVVPVDEQWAAPRVGHRNRRPHPVVVGPLPPFGPSLRSSRPATLRNRRPRPIRPKRRSRGPFHGLHGPLDPDFRTQASRIHERGANHFLPVGGTTKPVPSRRIGFVLLHQTEGGLADSVRGYPTPRDSGRIRTISSDEDAVPSPPSTPRPTEEQSNPHR